MSVKIYEIVKIFGNKTSMLTPPQSGTTAHAHFHKTLILLKVVKCSSYFYISSPTLEATF